MTPKSMQKIPSLPVRTRHACSLTGHCSRDLRVVVGPRLVRLTHTSLPQTPAKRDLLLPPTSRSSPDGQAT
jgi:hypothetical protein